MGNRAVITCSTSKTTGVGIYLHWNGGLESVLAFLEVARQREYRDPVTDESYAMARLTGLIHEFLGTHEETGLGIGVLKDLDCDNGDNGTYVIGANYEIIKRWGEGCEPKRRTLDALTPEDRLRYHGIINKLEGE